MPERTVACCGCSTRHHFEDVVPRRAECESCSAPLHCCRNCSHYEPTSYNECRESSAERVVDKSAANFCDYFAPAAEHANREFGTEARGKLEDLFKKP